MVGEEGPDPFDGVQATLNPKPYTHTYITPGTGAFSQSLQSTAVPAELHGPSLLNPTPYVG